MRKLAAALFTALSLAAQAQPATIDSMRDRYPELRQLDDESVVDVLHQVFYSDLTRETVAAKLGVKLARPAPPAFVPLPPAKSAARVAPAQPAEAPFIVITMPSGTPVSCFRMGPFINCQ